MEGTVAPVRVIETELGPLRVVNTLSDAAALWDWTRERRSSWLGLDAETNAHDPFAPSYLLRTTQIADESSGWVIHAERPDMLSVVRTVVSAHDAWVAWFARNDINFIERGAPGSIRLGQWGPHVADGQVALAYYDPRTVTTASKKDNIDPRISRPRGLKPAAALNLGFDYLTEAETAMHARFREISPKGYRSTKAYIPYGFEHIDVDEELYNIYGGLDSIVACRLWNKMLAHIWDNRQWEPFQKDLRLQWHLDCMQFRGLHHDGPYVKWLHGQLVKIIEDNKTLLGYYHINPSAAGASIGQAFEWLFSQGYMATVNTKTTKTGGKCWDKTVIEQIIKNEPDSYAGQLAKAIQGVRKASKFDESYLRWMLAGLERDGRTHIDYRGIGTISSRNSASRWPAQQVPKREKKLKVRPAICAPPGWVLVTADLEQGEPRVMAGLSGDRNLRRDLLEGDLYSEIATMTYGSCYLGKEQGKDPRTDSYGMRQASKFAILAWSYSCGAEKLALLLGITAQEAQMAIRRWEARYPDLIRFRNRVNQQPAAYLESGWVAPLWDRYYVDDKGIHLGPKPSRLGLNYYTQGTQRHLCMTAVHRLIDWGWSWALYHVMHDEILLCVPEHMAVQAAGILEAAMTMEFNGIPITCEVDKPPFKRNWSDYPDEYFTTIDVVNELTDEILEGV